MKNVLVLCTGNSCRSVMGEGLLTHYGKGRLRGFSAGSMPAGKVHPMSLATLAKHGIKAIGYESKSWDVFKTIDIDIVITVCDNAAGEVCPIFPGGPVKTHWGVPDPAHFKGTEKEIEAEFERVFTMLERKVKALIKLPVEKLGREELKRELDKIVRL
jgi:arsenate reductase